MRKCKWCKLKYDERKFSSAFCDWNPNAEKNKAAYFRGIKRYRRIKKAIGKSLNSLFGTVLLVSNSPFIGNK